MNLHELKPADQRKARKRVGRGMSAGQGRYAGRGRNGQNSRSGGGTRLGFEGGNFPMFRRLPKRGFYNPFSKEYTIINVSDLNVFEEGSLVDREALVKSGLVKEKEADAGVKILGGGELEKKLTVQAHKFSQSAQEKIQAAGGKAEVI